MKIDYVVYQEGVDARYDQKGIEANPYPTGSSEHYDWYEGWSDCHEALYRNGKAPQAE